MLTRYTTHPTDKICRPSPTDASDEARTVVLASGGLDSSTLLALAKHQHLDPLALHVDYGQPSAVAEHAAVTRITDELDISLFKVSYRGSEIPDGEIRGRNAFLLHTALLEFSSASGVVLIGIHSGSGYADCSSDFIDLMQRSFDLYTGGSISVAAPFVCWTKDQIVTVAHNLRVPTDCTYSCETGNIPCGKCLSCVDRKALQIGNLHL